MIARPSLQIWQHDTHRDAVLADVFRWLAEPDAGTGRRRNRMVVRQDSVLHAVVPVVQSDVPALPLRPDHASRLEGVIAGDDSLARGRRSRGLLQDRPLVRLSLCSRK